MDIDITNQIAEPFVLRGGSGLPDDAARRIAEIDSGKNVLIEAGAGTGKTTALIKRLTHIISSGAAEIDRIVAITFTEMASTEMITRLRDALEEYLSKNTDITQEKLNIENALKGFENHRISTIHKFAKGILEEFPFDAGVDPKFEIVEDRDEREFMDEVWESWVKDKIDRRKGAIWLGYQIGLKTGFFKSLFDFLYRNRDHFESITFKNEESDIDYYFKQIEMNIYSALAFTDEFCTNKEDFYFAHIADLNKKIKRIFRMDAHRKISSLLSLKVTAANNKGKKENWTDGGKTKIIEILKELKLCIEELRADTLRKILDGCASELMELIGKVEDEKRARGIITFDDILIKTRNLLRDNPRVRRYYKNRFSRILVDEFQDTDPLQVEIVNFLAEVPDEYEKDWKKIKTLDGKLFFVGDPKQSIYGFRRADIEMYESVKEKVKESGLAENITVNFRTVPEIIDWVNDHFSGLIQKPEDGRYQPEYVPLVPRRTKGSCPPLFLLKPADDLHPELSGTAAVCKYEAEAIASFIKEIAGGEKYYITPKGKSQRPVSYKDIAVIFLRTTHINAYQDAFRKRNIPYLFEGGKDFFRRSEIIDIINVLKAIDNPRDSFSIVASLKSPFFAISDEELFGMKSNGIPFLYTKNIEISHPAESAFKILCSLHNKKHLITVSRLIEELFDKTLIREYYAATSADPRKSANIEKLVDLAREYSSQKRGTLCDFISTIDIEDDPSVREADAPVTDPGMDAVRIMTFHKSKGLEFPVVIFAHLGVDKSAARNVASFLINNATGLFEARVNDTIFTAGFEQLKELKSKKEDAEIARLLYVAATRARDSLVIPAFTGMKPDKPKETKKSKDKAPDDQPDAVKGYISSPSYFQSFLGNVISGEDAGALSGFEVIEYCKDALYEMSCEEAAITSLNEVFANSNIDFKTSLNNAIQIKDRAVKKAAGHCEWTSYTAEKKSSAEEEPAFNEESEQLKFGRAFHNVMEHIDLSANKPYSTLVNMACIREGVADPQKVEEMVKNALGSAPVLRALKCGKYAREFSFCAAISGKNYEGAIDLLICEPDGYVIVDYKTDDIQKSQCKSAAEKYKAQAYIYKNAVEKITGKKVKEILYYFVRADVASQFLI